ncbi:hypothetical protein QQS21_006190 [Conoideocrella luteorostrata]|uniref:Uncharacterized protein n=1 Tax=Conoideocrella luteorostrata TaxID=1105319 RepID=A0AAJ0CQT4_9HYPO|nr:hypothetical protein QQS21_006190 [Conoideocrella luteorostrata]
MRQLWSLDVSKNKVTDDAVQSLRNWCLPSSQLRSDVHSDVEGKLVSAFGGTDQYGPFLSIEDSDLSASFSHNERYFVDAPVYVAKSDSVAQEDHIFRQDGGALTRRDDAEEAIAFLAMDDDLVQAYDHQRAIGTTYLRLSHNLISAVGLQKLLHIADGHVEDLACDSMPFLPKAGKYHKIWPPGVVLTGILGAAHCFRPVMSPNLRVLRIHHSVITNIPTFHADGLSYTARLFLAETTIRERADAAFPQTFIPDMNPRLLSLTLTCLPRRSSGPLISRLIQFIKLLSIQERNIQDVSLAASTRRGPNLLKGLRHLRLEFEPDCVDDGLSTSVNLDAEELMNSGDKIFSFFEGERVEQPVSATASRSFVNELLNSKGVGSDSQFSSIGQSSGSDRDTLEFVTHHGHWNGKDFSVKVWIGPGSLDVPEVLKDYRQMVLKHHVVDGVGPATPAQIRAGAPQKSFVYHIAWSAAVMPPTLKSPTRGDLAGMSDVLDALKAYRSKGRSNYMQQYKLAQTDGRTVLLGNPHYFWRGRLEVSTEGEGPVA